MKKYILLLAISAFGWIFFSAGTAQASQCNSIQTCCMTVHLSFQATNWPGGTLHVSCLGDTGPFCRNWSTDMSPGSNATSIGCSCLRNGGCMQYGSLPTGCHFEPNPAICVSNGHTTSGTINVVCITNTPTPLPTHTPTPTNTPTPTTPPPSCGADCTSNFAICQHAINGCTSCLPKPGGGGMTCQPPPGCNTPCTGSNICQQGGSSCNICAPQTPGGATVCRTGTSQCGGYCDNTSVSCDSNSGCTCNLGTHTCEQPSPTPTNAPTSTPMPTPTPTTGACFVGKSCSNCGGNPGNCIPDCNGGWCNGGQCSSCTYVPGGCTKGVDCACQRGQTGCSCPPGQDSCTTIDCANQNSGPGVCTNMGDQRHPNFVCSQCGTGTVSPSPTITPTPSPVQPTTEVTMMPTPTTNPSLAPTGTQRSFVPRTSQRWVCLKAQPCSDPASGCSGQGAPDHRVKLSIKSDTDDNAKPIAGKPTYIFECLQTGNKNTCTTGNADLDREAIGTSYLPDLSQYGYNYNGIYFANGVSAAPNPIPASFNNNGNIGVYEWESYTDQNLKRLFLAMNQFDPNSTGGDIGAQQQGIIPFTNGGSKKCVQIQWDPSGAVTDSWTLQPVTGATVTLLKKEQRGGYSLVTAGDILNGVQNPITTDNNGQYNFMIPDGTYKIKVSKPGYDVYESNEIVQKGNTAIHNVSLQPSLSLFDRLKLLFNGSSHK